LRNNSYKPSLIHLLIKGVCELKFYLNQKITDTFSSILHITITTFTPKTSHEKVKIIKYLVKTNLTLCHRIQLIVPLQIQEKEF